MSVRTLPLSDHDDIAHDATPFVGNIRLFGRLAEGPFRLCRLFLLCVALRLDDGSGERNLHIGGKPDARQDQEPHHVRLVDPGERQRRLQPRRAVLVVVHENQDILQCHLVVSFPMAARRHAIASAIPFHGYPATRVLPASMTHLPAFEPPKAGRRPAPGPEY